MGPDASAMRQTSPFACGIARERTRDSYGPTGGWRLSWECEIAAARSRNRPRRWRGKTPVPVDQGPRQTGRSVRWRVPADRLRAVESGQRGVRTNLRADTVQVALTRPSHLANLVDIRISWRVHHARSGAAASRSAVVHGQRRRDLPVAEPDLRRTAGVHRRVRCRSRVPNGSVADGRGAHCVRRRGDSRRYPGAARRGVGLRCHRLRRLGQDHPLPGEAEQSAWDT